VRSRGTQCYVSKSCSISSTVEIALCCRLSFFNLPASLYILVVIRVPVHSPLQGWVLATLERGYVPVSVGVARQVVTVLSSCPHVPLHCSHFAHSFDITRSPSTQHRHRPHFPWTSFIPRRLALLPIDDFFGLSSLDSHGLTSSSSL